MAYTSDDLLADVRRGGSLPSSSSTGTADADLLAHADAELRDTLVPLMLGVHEEFYQRIFDTTTTDGVAGYRINKRAAISRINTVQWVRSDTSVVNLVRVEPKAVAELGTIPTSSGTPASYYLEGGRLVLWPTPSGSATLRIRAMVRPARLTLTTDTTNVQAISAVSVGATSTTLTITTSPATGTRDVVAGTPSFEHLCVDAAWTNANATTGTVLNTACSSTPAIGDYLCVSDYTPVIQLPVELHPALTELTVARVLRALGKRSEAADHAEEAQRLVSIGIQALTPRVDTADRKILGGPHYRRGRGAGLWVPR